MDWSDQELEPVSRAQMQRRHTDQPQASRRSDSRYRRMDRTTASPASYQPTRFRHQHLGQQSASKSASPSAQTTSISKTALAQSVSKPTHSVPPSVQPSALAQKHKAFAYLRGLDGIRAIAIIAALLFHFSVPHTQGGFIGVDLFFVVSGYLITSQLWLRWHDAPIRLKEFWIARFRRLLPAVFFLLIVTSLLVLIEARTQSRMYLQDILAAYTYVSNWWYVIDTRSYAAEWGIMRPPILQHLWSLAVEEQFYLCLPLVLAGLISVTRKKIKQQEHLVTRLFMALFVILGVASTVWMGYLSYAMEMPNLDMGIDPARLYYATDTHATPLLLGAALAMLRKGKGLGPSKGGKPGQALPAATPLITAAGAGAFFLFCLLVSQATYFSPWMYRGGFFLAALASAVMIVAATRPGVICNILSCKPLAWFGTRSYSLYLWHWPICGFTRPDLDIQLPEAYSSTLSNYLVSLVIRIVLTCIAAEISYRMIETPIRRQGFTTIIKRLHQRGAALLIAGVCLAIFVAHLGYAAFNPDKTVEEVLQEQTGISSQTAAQSSKGISRACLAQGMQLIFTEITQGDLASFQSYEDLPFGKPFAASCASLQGVYYGDSFAVGAGPGLQTMFKELTIHAKVAQQAYELDQTITDTVSDADVIILHTGNNGVLEEKTLQHMVDQLTAHARRVIVVQPRVPAPWQDGNRAVIERVCGTQKDPKIASVRVADWYEVSKNHDDYFADGVHPSRSGIEAYMNLIDHVTCGP